MNTESIVFLWEGALSKNIKVAKSSKMNIDNLYRERNSKLRDLGFSNYEEYLKSDEWKEIRKRVRSRKGNKWTKCNVCQSPKNLHIHHSSYKVLGTLTPGNTIKILCEICHRDIHLLQKKHPDMNLYDLFRLLKKIKGFK